MPHPAPPMCPPCLHACWGLPCLPCLLCTALYSRGGWVGGRVWGGFGGPWVSEGWGEGWVLGSNGILLRVGAVRWVWGSGLGGWWVGFGQHCDV